MKPIFTGIVVIILSIVSAVLLYFLGHKFGIDTSAAKAVVWACITVVTSLIFFIPLLTRMLWSGVSDRHSNLKHLNPEDLSGDSAESTHLIGVTERWEQLRHIHLLTKQYKKHRKPWIFVVTQDTALLEAALPDIRRQLWVETASAIWIDAQAMEPAGGWQYLRGVGKRPAEGIVSLQAKSSIHENAAQLTELMKKLGWKLPINQVYLTNEADEMPSAISHALKYGSTVSATELSLIHI